MSQAHFPYTLRWPPKAVKCLTQVMVANIRCAEIAAEQLQAMQEDQAWLTLSQQSEAGSVAEFGGQAGALISSSLAGAVWPGLNSQEGPLALQSIVTNAFSLRSQASTLESDPLASNP